MKLYFHPGACSLSPHIVLRELGLAFTLDRVDLATKTAESGQDFRQINPKGYVPALELDDGQVITEGAAIVQFLADTHPAGNLAPASGTVARAQLQAHLNFLSSELHKAFASLFGATDGEARAQAEAAVAKRFGDVEFGLRDGRPYLLGDTFSLADIYLFVITTWAAPCGVDLARWPNLAALAARVRSRPSVTTALDAEAQAIAA